MARIATDENDILVWKLNETSGPYRNTGSSLPNDTSTDLNITNTIVRTGSGIFDNAPFFPSSGTYPAGASATRNYAAGAKTINITPPLTVSCWVYLRNYVTGNSTIIIGKEYRDSTITSSWTTPFHALNISTVTTNNGQNWIAQIATSPTTNATITISDNPIPLQQWSHIGITYDGSVIRAFLNGVQCIYYSGSNQLNSTAAAQISYTDGINGSGFWKIGAITATGSSNKEEPPMLIQDIRVANVARPLSYFQFFYKIGVLPLEVSNSIQYYKLRVYDLSCPVVTAVTWVDTQISLTNAPVPPCGGPYSDIEIIDTWLA